MRLWIISIVVFLFVYLFTACQQDVGHLSKEDITAIKDVKRSYQEAAIAGDWDAWASLWSEDAVYMVPNTPIFDGRKAIRNMADAVPPLPDLNVTIDKIDGRADLALVRGTYSFTMSSEGKEEPTKDIGKYLWILKKQPDGTWQVAAECYNSDLPIPDKD